MIENLIESGREAQRVGAWDEALAHFEAALQILPQENRAALEADLPGDLLNRLGNVLPEQRYWAEGQKETT